MTSAAQFGVIGQPIAHSLSPRIHAIFARQAGIHLTYEALEVAPENFSSFLNRTPWRGFNVTMPLKGEAYGAAAELSDRARAAAAVNTMTRRPEGGFAGDNTDGVGLITDLTTNLRVSLTDQRVLMLGAGGAARGIAAPLMAERPGHFVVANRTVSRAEQLVATFGGEARSLSALADLGCFDVVIHASGAGYDHFPALPDSLAGPDTFCYDLSYGAAADAFLSWAASRSARAADGLGMLVEQAAVSFSIWHGVQPQSAPVIGELRRQTLA
ncbi:MAG: shikimate dehydrogenase [Pseudomonadota bacterium]